MKLLPQVFPVTCHTKYVGAGSTFIAIKGREHDGTTFIKEALLKGANKIVLSSDIRGTIEEQCLCAIPDFTNRSEELTSVCRTCNTKYMYVREVRKMMATMAANSNNSGNDNVTIIAITGTKGKTTTAFLVDHIIKTAGKKTALLSSLHNSIVKQSEPSSLTTPQSDYLHTFIATARKHEVTHITMEASSHAIEAERLYGLKCDAIGFTNLGNDHLDFHETEEKYFQTKAKFLSQTKTLGIVVINTDNPWCARAIKKTKQNIQFGSKLRQNRNFRHMVFDAGTPETGLYFSVSCQSDTPFTCHAPSLFGQFNVYNATMAALLCKSIGICEKAIIEGIRTFPGVPGRMQPYKLKSGKQVFIDFAHNPDSMIAALKTLRQLTKDLIVVFGSGGERDIKKRSVMGAIAETYANSIIVTNDNPRREDPQLIINHILSGITQQSKTLVEPDRAQAIKKALSLAHSGSIIAILGKGAETYMIVGDKQIPHSDLKTLQDIDI